NGTRYALVLHKVLEHGVVDGVGYLHNCLSFLYFNDAKVVLFNETAKAKLLLFSSSCIMLNKC
ncbi:MAG: hypothetical protein IJT98_00295, partial [Prevotella sp.]|nr:hypothetical protein [Prevotella sp.]